MPNRSLNEIQQKHIIQQYLLGSNQNPNSMDTWQSNQISRPLTKIAEEIQKTNPKLVKNVVTKNISH
ncbi:hypothetical protein ABVF33_05350 [Candidatus Rickettsia barbariae]